MTEAPDAIGEVMTTDVVTVRRIPVVDGDRLVRIVIEGAFRRWVERVAKE